MTLTLVIEFFFWCCILNGGLLSLWVLLMMFAPDLVYKTQYKWFPISEQAFAETMYRFLGLYKLHFLVFNLVPLIAMKLISGG